MGQRQTNVRKAVDRVQASQRALERARARLARVTKPRDSRACYHSRAWTWVQQAFEAKKAWLLAHPDVVGCGLGFRRKGHGRTNEPCITAYVSRKLSGGRLRGRRKLPRFVRVGKRRVAIDVVEGGRYEGQALIGDELGTTSARATLGAFARDLASGRDVALTAMHVSDFTSVSNGSPQVMLFVPSRVTDGSAPSLGTIAEGTKSGIDAAKIELAAGQTALPWVPDFGAIRGWRPLVWPADQNLPVWFHGAVSGRQSGWVHNPHDLFDDDGLDDVITAVIESQPGDSGAALMDNDGFVVGFLAGRRRDTDLRVFCPAQAVLERLGCDIPTRL